MNDELRQKRIEAQLAVLLNTEKANVKSADWLIRWLHDEVKSAAENGDARAKRLLADSDKETLAKVIKEFWMCEANLDADRKKKRQS